MAELVAALWPVLACIVGGFTVGVYVWANTKRDVRDALKLGAANADAIAALATRTEHHAERLAACEARQKEIAEGVKWIRANLWPRRRK